jgi:hypothetical protein
VFEVQTVQQAVPYMVEQPVIQPYVQRVIRQPVPVISQQIQAVPVPVVHRVTVPGQVQTILENAPPAQAVMAQPATKGAAVVAPIATTKGGLAGGYGGLGGGLGGGAGIY